MTPLRGTTKGCIAVLMRLPAFVLYLGCVLGRRRVHASNLNTENNSRGQQQGSNCNVRYSGNYHGQFRLDRVVTPGYTSLKGQETEAELRDHERKHGNC